MGFKYRKEIVRNVSKLAGTLYLVFGILLLFVAGGIPGGWIAAIWHQTYGFNYSRGFKHVLLLALGWTIVCLVYYTLIGVILSIFGISPFEEVV